MTDVATSATSSKFAALLAMYENQEGVYDKIAELTKKDEDMTNEEKAELEELKAFANYLDQQAMSLAR